MTNPKFFLIAVCIILPGLLNLSSARAVDNPGSRRARHGVEAIWVDTRTVSYTHLTLPTICSV